MKSANWQRDDWRIWRNPQAWPFGPSAYVYLAEAAEQLCARAWGRHWLRPFHYDWAEPIPPSADQVFDANGNIVCEETYAARSSDVRAILGAGWEYLPVSRDAWTLAHQAAKARFVHADAFMDQRDKAVSLLHDLFAEGVVQTAIKEIAHGRFHLVGPHAWYCERHVAEGRIRTCSIDMLNAFGAGTYTDTAPFPLFVPEQSLEQALVIMDNVRAGRGPNGPTVSPGADAPLANEGEVSKRSEVGQSTVAEIQNSAGIPARRGVPLTRGVIEALFKERAERSQQKDEWRTESEDTRWLSELGVPRARDRARELRRKFRGGIRPVGKPRVD
ncbi:hypothetical protein FHS54_001443 [Sphingobium vermicomposti]|uniref:Uncharacterized protein n=1 Tax=Sphingobium vermicomposti TaxID=529005 RepID=A0A846M2S9_9SPHN|nr:hypothetical protein [Sphingobium vermicomposti]